MELGMSRIPYLTGDLHRQGRRDGQNVCSPTDTGQGATGATSAEVCCRSTDDWASKRGGSTSPGVGTHRSPRRASALGDLGQANRSAHTHKGIDDESPAPIWDLPYLLGGHGYDATILATSAPVEGLRSWVKSW
jgi:hypothetical protein